MNTLNYSLITFIFLLIGLLVKFHRSEIKLNNELSLKSDTITLFKQQKYVSDSLVMNSDVFFKREKDFNNFKKYYFRR